MNNQTKLTRQCQQEADDAIYEELLVNNKCLVKMFCGTGKSRIMRYGKSFVNKKLCVYVFPSLALITQFNEDYLGDFPCEYILNVSSENGSTTDPKEIVKFLKKKKNKIICVTYQSFGTLLDNLGDNKINICCYDEAHHAVGEISQKLIFQNEVCEKQVFFTATPKNANGIVMYDRNEVDSGMCGNLVYDHTYLNGLNDDILNPIEIRIDMYMEDTNKSVYESIARAVILSGNNRVLTFHSEVNTDKVNAVIKFVHGGDNPFIKVL
jgi:superfamily II DNA or RNA helicase